MTFVWSGSTSMTAPSKVGAWFSLGVTVMGSTMVAVRPAGSSATDPAGRTATIVLPITVTPRENQAPTFDGAVIDVEPDQTKVIDLRKLTAYPYPNDQAELAYTVLEPKPTGFAYSLDGQKLTLRAVETTPKGRSGQITIGVRDDLSYTHLRAH